MGKYSSSWRHCKQLEKKIKNKPVFCFAITKLNIITYILIFMKQVKNYFLRLPNIFILSLGICLTAMMPTPSWSIELDEATRTVSLNKSKTVVLSPEQIKKGKRLFNASCSACHVGGITKTNPNVGLDPESLSLATPNRNNIEALVDYMKSPTSYDGLESIAEIHPSIKSADIFPKMRSLSDDDLYTIAGHILVQPNILTEKWGGGKIYY
uniref:Photosystem II cytochrome c550 n=1 Tax=Olisthodiscus luteus TaxID=83000 RepID=A0A7U0KST7_OLILU|nr:photosystem II cytochrome c550 [Olisthodiscus luteus]QQW50563.1 photosystem II cytochrome c550 [Olisthodiscus luteus]